MQFLSRCVILIFASLVISLPALGQVERELELRPGAGRAGTGFYTPHEWGVVRSTVVNGTGVPQTPLLTIQPRGGGSIQFAQRVWVPGGARLTTTTPIRIGELPPKADRGLEVESRLVIDDGGREIATPPEIGMLPIRDNGSETAVLPGVDDSTTALVGAMRDAAALPRATAYLGEYDVPSIPEGWSNVDSVVLSRDQMAWTPAQVEALRRWLIGGGRLMINLQRVEPAFAARLLGDAWDVAVLDRVELTEFAVESDGRPHRVSREYPLELVRVFAPGMEVTHRVAGYPAALRKPVGQGTLVVITLEADGWVMGDGAASPALQGLTWFVRGGAVQGEADHRTAALEAVASQQIGYSVIGRTPVLAVLAGFTLALLVVGLWLAKRDGLAQLAWVAPAMAVVAAGLLLILGLMRQSEVPFTLASAQLVRPASEAPYGEVASLVSVYTPPGAGGAQLAGGDALAWPEMDRTGGVRLVFDGGGWRYVGLPLREGAVQTAAVNTLVPLDAPAAAKVRLSAEGLEGEIPPAFAGMEDLAIVTPGGKLAPRAREGGGFFAPAVDALGPDQFFEGTVLTQRQMVRQNVYRRLLQDPGFPGEPMLLGWVDGFDLGLRVGDGATRRDTALVMLPLAIEPPQPGDAVAVPAALLRMRPFKDDKSLTGSPVYDVRNGEWVTPINTAQTVLMEFVLPEAVRGLTPTGATITVDLESPGRPYEFLVYDNGRLTAVGGGEDAAGTVRIDVPASAMPAPRPDGSVVVGLRVGEPADPLQPHPWSLTRMDVDLRGAAGDPYETSQVSNP